MGSVKTEAGASAKPYHHGDLRSALIAAALAALAEDGAEKLSLRGLAKRVGVSHNAPYMHFKNKEDLLRAVADHGFRELSAAISASLEGVTGWQTRISTGCQAYVRFAIDHPDHMQVMFRPLAPGTTREVSEAGAAALGLLCLEIERAQASGHIKRGNPWQFATLLWSLIHGIAEIAMRTGFDSIVFGDENVAARTDWMVRHTLDGLANSSPD